MSGAPSEDRSGLSFVLVTWTASVHSNKFAAGPRQLRLLSFHDILSIWYDTGRIEDTASNSSFIVAFAFVSGEGVYLAVT
jgi:hypothetical protein